MGFHGPTPVSAGGSPPASGMSGEVDGSASPDSLLHYLTNPADRTGGRIARGRMNLTHLQLTVPTAPGRRLAAFFARAAPPVTRATALRRSRVFQMILIFRHEAELII